jgi:hypothetical protein
MSGCSGGSFRGSSDLCSSRRSSSSSSGSVLLDFVIVLGSSTASCYPLCVLTVPVFHGLINQVPPLHCIVCGN